MIINLIGWLGTAIVIISYGLSVKYENAFILHRGNVVGALLLVPVQLIAGVPYAALLSAMFGTVAIVALTKRRNEESL